MPKKVFWIESLFSFLPADVLWQHVSARLGLLLGIWISGLLAYGLDGLMIDYVVGLPLYLPYFGTSFLILLGSYFMQSKLRQTIRDFRPLIKLDPEEFERFSEGLKRAIFSVFPCLVLAIALAFFTGIFNQLQQALAGDLSLHIIWNLLFNAFGLLLTATAIWMFASIWLTIFAISRQPLDLKLSSDTLARFRELSLLALWFALFYFVGVSIGNIDYLAGAHDFSVGELFLSPYLFFIILGAAGILLPFYNIHIVLLKMKRQESSRILKESERLVQQLDEALRQQEANQQIDRRIELIHYRLHSLQIKEKFVKIAREWPIDVSFVSKLMVLVLIPIITRIVAMLVIS
jgi:hypothetical protein